MAIQDFVFLPANLTIAVGDTVRWTPFDGTPHTTTSGSNGVADGIWDSGTMTVGANSTFSYTFTTAGTYPYFCRPHSTFMTGRITVNPSAQPPTVSLIAPAQNAVFIAPAAVVLAAEATPGGTPIEHVQFFANATQVGELSYDVHYADLTSPATAAHLHGPADFETAAGVLQPLTPDGALGTHGAFRGTLTLTLDHLAAVLDELTYVNLHTEAHSGGEGRGQVVSARHE